MRRFFLQIVGITCGFSLLVFGICIWLNGKVAAPEVVLDRPVGGVHDVMRSCQYKSLVHRCALFYTRNKPSQIVSAQLSGPMGPHMISRNLTLKTNVNGYFTDEMQLPWNTSMVWLQVAYGNVPVPINTDDGEVFINLDEYIVNVPPGMRRNI